MTRFCLFLFLVCAGIYGYRVVTRHLDAQYELETDRAWKGAKLQLMANGVHCDGS